MQRIFNAFRKHPHLPIFAKAVEENTEVQLQNAITSARSFFIAAAYELLRRSFVIVLSDKEEAAYLYNDLQTIAGNTPVFFFPASLRHLTLVSKRVAEKSAMMMRTETLAFIRNKKRALIVAYPEALAETVIQPAEIPKNTIELQVGDEIDIVFLEEMLKELGFVKKYQVFEPGEFAVRGGVFDVFSYDAEYPYRIDFFGEEIENIKIFDVQTQFSVKNIDKISIINNIQLKKEEERISFLQFIDNQAVIFSDDFTYLNEVIKNIYEEAAEIRLQQDDDEQSNIFEFADWREFEDDLMKFKRVILNNHKIENIETIKLSISQQPRMSKNFDLLAQTLLSKQNDGHFTYILSQSSKQLVRLQEILHSQEVSQQVDFESVNDVIHSGFSDNDLFLTVFTDHQIFGRYHKYKLKNVSITKSKEAQILQEIRELQPGDYVVHQDFGIGIFKGLKNIDNNGVTQEVLHIVYKDNDNLFVNVHSFYKISKYKNKDAEPPTIHKLGSSTWKNLKKRTKKKIKDIAKELIALYAKRLEEKGFAFSEDTYLQEALEASFMYEETPDQIKIIEEVKQDMEKNVPMDRLVCGDVGFGKTEIAVRAAFKAVCDNKQVVLLCPTTVLAYQHYRTFTERMKDLPVTIDFLTRMRSTKDKNEILRKLQKGTIDIIIGTHRVVSKDVKFKDLGLLIIDEEQKFGVSVKERLKQLRVNVDTLTLTATPIPRTLQFSLMGARDLSVLQTPPPNRQPIITELHTFDKKLIQKAIRYEVNRNGQVFFVHNHVDTLPKIQRLINQICPNVTVEVAHGRMKGVDIERIITDFINQKFDVLITTTIIENGIDIPNANTIIINNAHKFGLSELHQLRGRVGRSARKAFCYLIAPPKTALKPNARRRLVAIENFVELGSGFNIALQDLDIRGAGDILGAEQSGFINEIGYETFKRILEEAMLELRTTDYKHIFSDKNQGKDDVRYVSDCQILTDVKADFKTYIEDPTERLKIYKQIDNIEKPEEIEVVEKQLIDRFGKMPAEAKELLNLVNLRLLAMKLGIEKIILKQSAFICYFVTDKESAFYDSELFTQKILGFVALHGKDCELKEKNDKLLMRFNNVNTINYALNLLTKILP